MAESGRRIKVGRGGDITGGSLLGCLRGVVTVVVIVLVVVLVGRRKGGMVWVWKRVLQLLGVKVEGYGSGDGDILVYG